MKGDTAELYKAAKAGDVLLGKLSLGPGASQGCASLSYVIPPQAKVKEEEESDKEKPALIDLQLPIVEKIKDDKEKEAYLSELLAKNPKHLPLLLASLKAVKDDAESEVIEKAADRILAEIDEAALAAYLGRKPLPTDEQTEEDKKVKKDMDIRKSAWNQAYLRKLQARQKARAPPEEQKEIFTKYRTFLDSPEKDADFGLISAKRDIDALVCQFPCATMLVTYSRYLCSDMAPP